MRKKFSAINKNFFIFIICCILSIFLFFSKDINEVKNFKVPGAIWEITKKHEKILDNYEGVNMNPSYYQKEYLFWKGKKVLVYVQNIYTKRKPSSSYFHTIVQGYKDCSLDLNYLKKRIYYYTIDYDISW